MQRCVGLYPIITLPAYVGAATIPLDIRHEDRAFLSSVTGRGMPPPSKLLQGTLDLLILKTLNLESMHGWAIAQRIQQLSLKVLQIGQGSLYPALHRLEYKGWIQSEWGASENNRKAKFYSLTRTGKKQLAAEVEQWSRLSEAIALVLKNS
jgi:PadR family transcriptional regulator PadR